MDYPKLRETVNSALESNEDPEAVTDMLLHSIYQSIYEILPPVSQLDNLFDKGRNSAVEDMRHRVNILFGKE